MARNFTTVGVVGLGTMGAGIVEVFAREGLQVVGVEPTEDALERGREHLRHSTDRAVRRGKLSEDDRDALVGRVRFTTSMEDLADVDLVIEAVPERLDLKQEIFAAIDKVCRPDTILATNTSSLSVTEISVATTRPSKVVGMHFFNPAPVLKLVEVVRTVVTEQEVVERRLGAGRATGQDAGRHRRQGRLHRQRAAVRLPQPRGLDVRRALRDPGGHRRGDAARAAATRWGRWRCWT